MCLVLLRQGEGQGAAGPRERDQAARIPRAGVAHRNKRQTHTRAAARSGSHASATQGSDGSGPLDVLGNSLDGVGHGLRAVRGGIKCSAVGVWCVASTPTMAMAAKARATERTRMVDAVLVGQMQQGVCEQELMLMFV